jgi:hypothetical protein
MAARPSPSSTSPSNLSNSPFPHGSHGSHSSSTSSSPPKPFASHNTMTADVFAPHMYAMPGAVGERRPLDKSPANHARYSILLRKLPSTSDRDAVRNILLFAKDLVDCEILPPSRHADDKGFASAIAHFQTLEGAKEARQLLDGKRNATNDATLVVELTHDASPGAIGSRRNTVDSTPARQPSGTSAMTGATINARQSSRYNGTFQNMENMSPPNGTPGLGNGEFPVTNLFSPTSPVNTSFTSRNLGKSVINEDADDDDGLLNESIGYATGGPPMHSSMQRRATNPHTPSIPIQRFGSLSLNTNGVTNATSPPLSNFASPRSGSNMQSPGPALSALSPHSIPSALSSGPNTGYQQYTQHFARPTYPPVNPADQNPPCNTLYVGNLPMDTSEDELKAVFSKQRGYKRLCFRTKQNGPMCFVEFEDTSFATKALNELYGYMLHNSVKGGIRLSFSKNPLGVRSGQNSVMGPQSANAPSTPLSGFGSSAAGPPGFSTATGPPPGLSVPPGLSTTVHSNNSSGFGMYSNGGFGMGHSDMAGAMRQPLASSGAGNGFSGYSTYMMGR